MDFIDELEEANNKVVEYDMQVGDVWEVILLLIASIIFFLIVIHFGVPTFVIIEQ